LVLGGCNLFGEGFEVAGPDLEEHLAEVASANQHGSLGTEQSRGRPMRLCPRRPSQDDFYVADIALWLGRNSLRQTLELRDELLLVRAKLRVMLGKEIFLRAAASGVTLFFVIPIIENNLDRASHGPSASCLSPFPGRCSLSGGRSLTCRGR